MCIASPTSHPGHHHDRASYELDLIGMSASGVSVAAAVPGLAPASTPDCWHCGEAPTRVEDQSVAAAGLACSSRHPCAFVDGTLDLTQHMQLSEFESLFRLTSWPGLSIICCEVRRGVRSSVPWLRSRGRAELGGRQSKKCRGSARHIGQIKGPGITTT